MAMEMNKINVKMINSVYLGVPILYMSQTALMSNGMTMQNQSMETRQKSVT